MIDSSLSPSAAPAATGPGPTPVADGATTPEAVPTAAGGGDLDGAAVADIDPRRVVRLAMHPREGLYLARLDDGATRALEPEAWHTLVRAVEHSDDRRLVAAPAGVLDVIWRVERRDAPEP